MISEDFDLDALLATMPDIGLAELERADDTDLVRAMRAYETALPRGYLSNSQISTYLKCGRAYEFRYVLGASSRSNTKMAQGSAVHAASDQLHKSMISGSVLGLEELKATYSDEHDKAFDPNHELIVDEEDTDAGAVKDRGMQLVTVYRTAALGQYVPESAKGEAAKPPLRAVMPVASERVIRTAITLTNAQGEPVHEPVPLLAILDIEEPMAVRDLKVRSKKPNASEAENSLQLGLYSVASVKPDVSIDALIKPSVKLPPRYMRLEYTPTAQDKHHAVSIATEVADDIRLGRFRMTSPDNWWCSESWCSYWSACRGKKT